jgi:hypothetical protein
MMAAAAEQGTGKPWRLFLLLWMEHRASSSIFLTDHPFILFRLMLGMNEDDTFCSSSLLWTEFRHGQRSDGKIYLMPLEFSYVPLEFKISLLCH